LPAKEYAFLELNTDLDTQGFVWVDPLRVNADFAKEKSKLKERAAYLTALEKRMVP